ncbi:MAG: type II toxin-antitoxin system Phd/YefM family antitoxin [Clostridiales Family XIII bacterium]|nr:type II toxin-antitoxin system Phd/YefM family antitoxin [Clostridiales Family XIII bacterium]
MQIKSSAELRNNYRKVADFCKTSGETVFLTNNGEGELAVMSIDAYKEQRKRLAIEKELLRLEAEEATGRARYVTLDELQDELSGALRVAENTADDYE